MKQRTLLILALLCMFVQGIWADTWDGETYKRPEYNPTGKYFVISSAAELAYIQKHFLEATGYQTESDPNISLKFRGANYQLTADLDMGDAVSWIPIGNKGSDAPMAYNGTFEGNGHTIRIHIWDATDNYQGLFASIDERGHVSNLRVSGSIKCSRSRLVGGIAGKNGGYIQNCVVTADISSDWHEPASAYSGLVGGIVGENYKFISYCCVTGNVSNNDRYVGGIAGYNQKTPTLTGGGIEHCTFYGKVISTHDQKNIWIGGSDGESYIKDCYSEFSDEELTDYLSKIDPKYTLYCEALQYPYTISVSNEGYGTIEADLEKTRAGKTVTLTITKGSTLKSLSVKDADGGDIALSGDASNGYTFTMPKRNVSVKAVFADANWADDFRAEKFSTVDETNCTITITTREELALFAYQVNHGIRKSGTYQLGADLDMSEYEWKPIGRYIDGTGNNPMFMGTFDGNGHTISGLKVAASGSEYVGFFGYVINGEVKNLKLVDSQMEGSKYVGAIIGYSSVSTIQNCYVGSDVTLKAETEQCGGIVGCAYTTCTIKGCYSSAQIDCPSQAGGIVGHCSYSEVKENVCQGVIINGTSDSDHRAYIYGVDELNKTQFCDNYYVASDASENVGDVRAFHVQLDSDLKDMGYSMTCGDETAAFDCSGLAFVTTDGNCQFKIGKEWYAPKDHKFIFVVSAFDGRATVDDVKVNDVAVSLDDAYYYFTVKGDATVSGRPQLTLGDTEDNSVMLKAAEGKKVNVTLAGRTLYHDESWNTLCLPFDIKDSDISNNIAFEGTPLAGATAMGYDHADFYQDTGTLELVFAPVWSVKAGMPFLVKWSEGNDQDNLQFENVSIASSSPQEENLNDGVDFVGCFSPISLSKNNKSVLYLGADNNLYYPGEAMTVNSFRAYFKLQGIIVDESATDPANAAALRSIVLNLGDGQTTGILSVPTDVQDAPSNTLQGWYDLSGRRLEGKPTQRGIYIYNGKKVVVK